MWLFVFFQVVIVKNQILNSHNSQNSHPTLMDLVKFLDGRFFWGAHVVMLNRKSSRAEEAEKKVLEEAPGSKAPLNGSSLEHPEYSCDVDGNF